MTILLSSPLRGFLNEIVSVMSAIGLVLSPHTSVLLTCTELALWNTELRSTQRVGSE
jgi:hypothetical protein